MKNADLVEDKLLLLSAKVEGALTDARNEERQLQAALAKVQARIAKISAQLEKIIERAESGIDALTSPPKKAQTRGPQPARPRGAPSPQVAPRGPVAAPAGASPRTSLPAPSATNAAPGA